jgi:hypothetical protein
MNNNNNNNYSPQQNIVKSPIAYPIQLSQNLNCGFFIILNKPPFYSMPFYNYLPLYQMAYQQNPQASIINVNNNDKAENQTNYNYNYYYNNTNPYYSFYYNNNSIPSVNNQENLGPTTPAPPPQEALFLNKKRNHTVSYDNCNENEISNLHMNNDENPASLQPVEVDNYPTSLQPAEIDNFEKMQNLENKETKVSMDANIIKDDNFGEKIENNSEKNEEKEINGLEPEQEREQEKEQREQTKEVKTEEKKKKKKRKNNLAELLQDTFLEHIGEPKKKIGSSEKQLVDININIKTSKNKNKNDSKNKNKQKSINKLNESNNMTSQSQQSIKDKDKDKDKDKKKKIKPLRNQRKKPQHRITLKNNKDILADLEKNKKDEKSVSNPKLTKVIFHGENYEKTKSSIDFMKYNFDFSIEEQYKTKKLITDYEHQHIDLIKINENFYDNYNANNHNLENTEQKWSRKKFEGDNKELKKVISLIRDTFQGRKIDTNEEKCLNILKKNHYNIDELLKSKSDK